MGIRSRFFAASVLCGMLAAGLSVPQTANAYPPGRQLIVSLLPNLIQPTTGISHLRVKNTKPGPVSVQIGDLPEVTLNGVPGFANYNITGLPSGKYRVVITSGDESVTKYIYVPRPIVIPQIQVISRNLDILFRFIPQGTQLSFALAGKPVSGVNPATIGATEQTNYTLPSSTLKFGNNNVAFLVGPDVSLAGSVNGIYAPVR